MVYGVELIDPNTKSFEIDWSLVNMSLTITATEEASRKYWNPQNIKDEVKEVLTESSIKIVKRL